MKKLGKKLIAIFIIIFAVAQILFIYQPNKTNKFKRCINQSNVRNYRTLAQFNNELNCLTEKQIIAANEIDGKWHIKLKIQGNKQDILDELSKLKAYDISDYIINYNENESSIIIEITDSIRA